MSHDPAPPATAAAPERSAPDSAAPPPVFTPEQVTRLIQRAAELDAHGDRLDADEVRRIAREAGIDGLAMDQAIGELLRGEVLPAPSPEAARAPETPEAGGRRGRHIDPDRMVRSLLMSAGAGLAAGLFAALAFPLSGMAVAAVIVFLLVRAAQLMGRGAVLEFELQCLLTILVFVATFAPLAPRADEDVWAPMMVMIWLVSSVLGGLIVWYGGRSLESSEATDTSLRDD